MPTRYPKRLASEFRVADPDRGRSTPAQKVAVPLGQEQVIEREDERAGLRDLDARLERAEGMTRAQRDAQRILPRATPAEIPNPRMERELGSAGDLRGPLSGRQQKARRKASRAVQRSLPAVQYRALERVLDERTGEWAHLNDALSDSVGDVDALTDRDRQVIHRIDRAIQSAEKANDRGHVVYSNVRMPPEINRSNLAAWVSRQYQPGDEFAFDRYTGAAHSLHEVTPVDDPAGRVAVLEIQTRRGIYLGGSEGTDDTAHLLPRGLQLRVVGTHEATYQSRTGERGTRIVIQMLDITPEPARRQS
ncbi:MAG: hypothetical protein LCH96_14650 [Actinobacteria bacterium]|nr:hypothetical protein [Actinomycetota bacterium]